MKSMRMEKLLEAMRRKYSPDNSPLNIKRIGLQEGENLNEKILENGPYSNEVEEFTIEEIMEKI